MSDVLIGVARDLYEVTPAVGPSPQPCLCGAPRTAHTGAGNRGGAPATGCRRYRRNRAYDLAERARRAETKTFEDIVRDWQAIEYPRPRPKPGGWGVGPSDVNNCRRAIQYRERPPADLTYDPVIEGPAFVGTLLHDAYLRARKALFPWLMIEHAVSIPGLDRIGRADAHNPIAAITDDVKTFGEASWEYLGAHGIKPGFWKQVGIYAYGLALQGYPSRTLTITAIRRSNGQCEPFPRPYDAEAARGAVGELLAINTALDLGVDLPRDGRGPASDKICSDYCPFRSYCWNIPAAHAAGRSPESYTMLGEDPEADEIAWAARVAREWADNKSEAETEATRTKSWLLGVPDGTYGDVTVKQRQKRTPLYGEYHRLVRAALEGGATVEQINAIEVPYSISTYPEVRKVRAAARREKDTPT